MLARQKGWISKLGLGWILLSQMFPLILIIIPLFLLLRKLHLNDSHAGLVFVYVVWTLPFILWMLQSYVRGIPRDLEEAAMVDGASRLYVLRTVIAPLLAPGIVVTALFAFITAWNEFFFALVLLQTPSLTTLPLQARPVRRDRGNRQARPARGECSARHASEPPSVHRHPALADARPHVRGGQGLVHDQTKGGTSMKKLLALSTALLLCIVLAASAATAGKSKQNVVNLNFATYVWQPTTVKAMSTIVDSWNKTHPGIQVHIVPSTSTRCTTSC